MEACIECGRPAKHRQRCNTHYTYYIQSADFVRIVPKINQAPKYIRYLRHNMLERTTRPTHPNYKYYGGRGIKVCERWSCLEGSKNMYKDLGPRPSRKHSLDRIDNNGDYTPDNCRWATKLEQIKNRRPFKRLNTKKRVAERGYKIDIHKINMENK